MLSFMDEIITTKKNINIIPTIIPTTISIVHIIYRKQGERNIKIIADIKLRFFNFIKPLIFLIFLYLLFQFSLFLT